MKRKTESDFHTFPAVRLSLTPDQNRAIKDGIGKGQQNALGYVQRRGDGFTLVLWMTDYKATVSGLIGAGIMAKESKQGKASKPPAKPKPVDYRD